MTASDGQPAVPIRTLTRIVVTLGPALDDDATLAALVDLGAGVFRLNFSHGDLVQHGERLARVRRLARECGRTVAVLGDLPGPKIRIGKMPGDGAAVAAGDSVILARGDFVVDPAQRPLRLSATYPRLIDELKPGERVLIDDGAVRLIVLEVSADAALCRATVDGRVQAGKGINLPESTLTAPAFGERDRGFAEWAIGHDLDFLALSFVTAASDVVALREFVAEVSARGGAGSGRPYRMPIIAKIERPQAVEAIDAIVQEADAIMVARGDLGVEIDFAQVPLVQMRLLDVAHRWGKPSIVATQMLQSMVTSPAPTRAEASDVATAILRGCDGVMLSGETAVGRWPIAAVDAMRRIAEACEAWQRGQPQSDAAPRELAASGHRTAAIAHGVAHIARDTRAACLVVWSQAGGGARYLSQNEFQVPIVAFSSDPRAVRQMALCRGVFPVLLDPPPATIALWRAWLDPWLVEHGWARRGDRAVIVAGTPLGVAGVTNAVVVHEVGAASG